MAAPVNSGFRRFGSPLRAVASMDEDRAEENISWALASLADRLQTYRLCEDYYYGHHRLLFATEKFRNAFGGLFQAFADNLMPAVVDPVADRLVVDGFDGRNAKQATKLWKAARMPRVAGQVHLEALRDGDAYCLVWPDSTGEPQIWPQEAELCTVEYDDEVPGKITRAAKTWQLNDKRIRLNLYFPDRIERYVSRKDKTDTARDFEPYTEAEDGQGPLVQNAYDRVPMFHFGNNAEIGEFGVSEILNAIPLQDALNKAMCDMLVAMEFQAFPQRYATGLQLEIDPDTGKPSAPPFTPGVDRMWSAAGDVKFGQFPSADLHQYVSVQDSIRLEIARVTGTPLHYLSVQSQTPSGEALKTLEGRLVKKVEDRQVQFGDVWADVTEFALRIQGAKRDPEVELIWRTPSPHNPLLDSEVQMVKQQLGVSHRQSLRELGYTEQQIDEMVAEEAEWSQQQFENQQKMAILGSVTGSGGLTPQGSPGAPGSAGAPVTSEGGKLPLRAPQPRVTVGKDWQEPG